MLEIAGTWASLCDNCIFFIGGEGQGPDEVPPCQVVDLSRIGVHDRFESHQGDGRGSVTSVPRKLQIVYSWAGAQPERLHHDWTCFAESDVYFVVPNFRRLVRRRELSPEDPHWLGYTHLDKITEEGATVEPFHGACLSRASVARLAHLRPGAYSGTTALWPPTRHECRMAQYTDAALFTNIFNSCMRVAVGTPDGYSTGIYPSDPELTFDERGRLLYLSWTPLHCGILSDESLRPPDRPYSRGGHGPYGFANTQNGTLHGWNSSFAAQELDRLSYWKGREYIYSRCLTQNTRWVGESPVMFHGHVTHAPSFLALLRRSRSFWKADMLSQRQVHSLLRRHDWRLPDSFSC